ncbi:class II glutamine amidotransferase [Arthrobacter livingstonensis]|uniref:Class II glutamine amidotransferase n=1 Tax=Arthrobacter livingstonensis TaxID=670078 RepID=A0A2V5L6R3_9MICC|nr:class II glutamine amidotransferase [Arthrobacter livingstonensis]PYI66918.1 class II glutamine amidotransferase [Arthrobacter livingstonensis]
MCRLFGLHAGAEPVQATFWLLKAPDSLSEQSRREPDGTGIGVFSAGGVPEISKQAIAAFVDEEFATAARELKSTTFVAHVRYATTGAHTTANTHPFEQDGRICAHNGAFGELDRLDARLADLGGTELVLGQTDSERMFALITLETRRHGGDLSAGISTALTWIAENLPVYSLNLVITTATGLWALRYPETHELHVLERAPGGHRNGQPLKVDSSRIHGRSQVLAGKRAVVVATEPMDSDPGWRMLEPGELLHVDAGLTLHSSRPLPPSPARRLLLTEPVPPAAPTFGAAG